MTIWVDADGCPRNVVQITKDTAAEAGIECFTVSNFHHEFGGDHHITVDDRSQSVDLTILNRCLPGDVVVTQDIGLAAMVLGKRCMAIGIFGQLFNQETMPLLLEMREHSAKIRRAGGRTKGPKKRTAMDDKLFEQALRKVLLGDS